MQKNMLLTFFSDNCTFCRLGSNPKMEKSQYLNNGNQYEYQKWLRHSSLWTSPPDIGLRFCIAIFVFWSAKLLKNIELTWSFFTNVHLYKTSNLWKFYKNWTSIPKVMGWSVKYLTDYLTAFSSSISSKERKSFAKKITFLKIWKNCSIS